MAFPLGMKTDLAWWERKKRISFLRRAARAGSFKKNLKGPEKKRAALFLPHPISQAASPVLPLQLLAVCCCPRDGSAASFAWIAFKYIQENISDTPTSKMLCWSRSTPQAYVSPLLRMWLWVCAACFSLRDISYPAWAAAALCPTKIRVYAGLSWEVLLCLSYSFSSGCHDSPLWKSLFILSGNLFHQTS